jgi:AraC family transcriptional regulator, regulatory protein of adaptative response / methylated-DNA-[protein]-cysteine methyltransferase
MLDHDATGCANHRLAVFGRGRLDDGRGRSLACYADPTVSDGRALDWSTCDRARIARDPRFDGCFFTGVLTTRIYCRPTCPVKPAKSRNVVFFRTAAAAERAGFRPCLRCRPETGPGTPAWHGAAATVSRALRLIERGFLDDGKSVEDLAGTLGMTARHLRRLFLRYAGASPTAVAGTRRVQRAKALVDESAMPMSAIAFAAGFASIRRFNAAFRAVYKRPPTAIRRARRRRQPGTASNRGVAETVAGQPMVSPAATT